MKKLILSFAVIAALGFTSCSSDDDNNDGGTTDCVELATNVNNATTDYASDPSTANCNALRGALQAAIDANCTSTGYQTILDSLPCN